VKKEKAGTIRATRIEIRWNASQRDRRDAWMDLSVRCQQMVNRLWQIWLVHHSSNGSAKKIRDHLNAYAKWSETKEGQRPEWPVNALGVNVPHPETGKMVPLFSLYSHPEGPEKIMAEEFPDVAGRTRGLVINKWKQTITSRKSAKGTLPGWCAILLAFESVPSFTRPQPIPFDIQNASIAKDADGIKLTVRIDRDAITGKSEVDVCGLVLDKRKCRSVRAIVEKTLTGVYEMKGSSVMFSRGKWFFLLSYQMPVAEKVAADESKVLTVFPGRKRPWILSYVNDGDVEYSHGFGGNSIYIGNGRSAIERERFSRLNHSRWGGSNQKGHGRSRAMSVSTKLSSKWKDFVKRYNGEITRRVIQAAVRKGCGKIVYVQPKEGWRDTRCLSTVGRSDRSKMTWDYFQFGSMLASKCHEMGIEFELKSRDRVCRVKTEEEKNGEQSNKASARGVRGVRRANGTKPGKRPARTVTGAS
jgi:hypothetical protein